MSSIIITDLKYDKLRLFLSGLITRLFTLYLLSHILSCLFIYYSNSETDSKEGDITYLDTIYFVYQTATVVGYGDVDLKRPSNLMIFWFFTIFAIYFGILSMGYTYNFINQSMQQLDSIQMATGSGMEQFEVWLSARLMANPTNTETEFVQKMKSFQLFLHRYDSRRALDYNDMLSKISSRHISIIRTQVAQNLMIGFDYLFAFVKSSAVETLLLGAYPVGYLRVLTQICPK